MEMLNAQQDIVENNEDLYIRQMELDTQKEIQAL